MARASPPRDATPLQSSPIDYPLCCNPDQATMTEKTQEPHVEEDDDELDGKLNYKPPPQKTLQELQELDKDDESLAKYKKSLLGDGPVVVGRLGHAGRDWGDASHQCAAGMGQGGLKGGGEFFHQAHALLLLEDWGWAGGEAHVKEAGRML